MGWTIYDRAMSAAEAKAECDRLCSWNNAGSRSRVLASGIVGPAYYAAVETIEPEKGRTVWAAVFLIQTRPFGYKDMSEDMGPCEDRAPLAVLRALEPLPAEDSNPPACETCEGTGKLSGPRWHESAQGAACHACDGSGKRRDRHAYARDWRRRAWLHHGGERALDMAEAVDPEEARRQAQRAALKARAPLRSTAPQASLNGLALFDADRAPSLL